ncbi:MAG: hypothetical protein H8Z69_01955 [Nanohaloarchaea archaeon]|nr:hypothetical protein [Candidatus Nanohaloarchaea archaeon]
MGDEKLLKLETRIENIVADRESKNGNKYTALVLPDGEWVFVWEGDWKQEVERFAQTYRNLEVDLYVVDREDDPDDHFYNLKAVLAKDDEVNEKLFEAKKSIPKT